MIDSVSYLMNYEISILFVRFAIEHSFFRKEFPILVVRIPEMGILLKVFRYNAFLPEEFSSIHTCCKNFDCP